MLCLEGGKWFTLGKEGFAWGTGGREKQYRLTITWTSSKTVFRHFPDILRVLFTDCFKIIASQKNAYFWICLQNFSWKINFWETFEKLLQSNVSKKALSQVFFCNILKTVPKDFRFFSKFFQSFSTSHSVPFKFMHAFIHQLKDADVKPNCSC